MNIELQEWNLQTVALVQALLGAISPNFRMVVLDRENETWIIYFILERDDELDREEIKDVVTQFEALQEGAVNVDWRVKIASGLIGWPVLPARVVYRRREGEL